MKLNTKRVVNLGLISKFRTELMGIATLLILICHAPANGFTLPTILDRAIRWGGIGVDFFLLFSGIGLYYSLRKTDNLLVWYKRRYLRIFVPFLLFAIPYYLFRKFIDGDSWLHFIGNITTLSFWTRHEGAWFVAMLVPLYLLTPLIAWFTDKAKNRWTPTIVLCVLSILGASIPTTNAIFDNIQMCLGHVSSFFIGYWIAKYVFEGKEIEFKWIYIYIPIFIVIYYFYRHLHISSNWMIVLPISILLTALFDYIGGGYYAKYGISRNYLFGIIPCKYIFA